MSVKQKVFIVYAHQEPKSFNGALKDVAKEIMERQGHDVTVSDLYQMKFDPTASKHAFTDLNNKDYFNFQEELGLAARNDCLPNDIKTEIEKIVASDLIILQFPLYWLGLPAILKGWIDRCFAENVVFETMTYRWFDNGPCAKKRIMLSFTTGGEASFFSNKGLFGDMDVILWPIHNALRFTGFQVLAPQISYAPANASEKDREVMLESWKSRLQHIWKEEPLKFIHIKHFDPINGFQLSEKYLDNIHEQKCGPTVGQNLGQSFQKKGMTKVPTTVIKHHGKL